jgi:hypothetical protein
LLVREKDPSTRSSNRVGSSEDPAYVGAG